MPLPIFAMVAMPNHWHFVVVVRPATDDQVSEFFRRLAVMHTLRYHAHYKTSGTGHLYQGRFKSFPIQSDERWGEKGGQSRLLTIRRCRSRGAMPRSARVAPGGMVFHSIEPWCRSHAAV